MDIHSETDLVGIKVPKSSASEHDVISSMQRVQIINTTMAM